MSVCYQHTKCKMDAREGLIFSPVNKLNILPTTLFTLLTYILAPFPLAVYNFPQSFGEGKK